MATIIIRTEQLTALSNDPEGFTVWVSFRRGEFPQAVLNTGRGFRSEAEASAFRDAAGLMARALGETVEYETLNPDGRQVADESDSEDVQDGYVPPCYREDFHSDG